MIDYVDEFKRQCVAIEDFMKNPDAVNDDYTAILSLDKMLTAEKIPHELTRAFDGWKIAYPDEAKQCFDVVEHMGSYGSQRNLLEAYGLGIKDVEGFLTAEEALELFKRVHNAKKLDKVSLWCQLFVMLSILPRLFTDSDLLFSYLVTCIFSLLTILIEFGLAKTFFQKARFSTVGCQGVILTLNAVGFMLTLLARG